MKSETKEFRMLLVMPLLVLPFLTVGFWAMGGGTGSGASAKQAKASSGLRTDLPVASLQPGLRSKLDYYDKASSDSARLAEQMRGDPYASPGGYPPADGDDYSLSLPGSNGFSRGGEAGHEQRLQERLHALSQTLNAPQPPPPPAQQVPAYPQAPALERSEVDRLEQMMGMMQGGGEKDPEMAQLSGMLENILDIQHPGRVEDRLRKASESRQGKVFSVSPDRVKVAPSVLEGNGAEHSGFFSAGDPAPGRNEENSLPATVHGTQVLVDGSVLKFRLGRDIFIDGQKIPREEYVYGLARLDGERLKVNIDNLVYRGSVFPVRLKVYDTDGMEGLYVPGAMGRDVAKQSGSDALQGLSMGSLDPSIGAQAASAGIELTKSFLGRKVKLVKVTVKEGYRVLLHDDSN